MIVIQLPSSCAEACCKHTQRRTKSISEMYIWGTCLHLQMEEWILNWASNNFSNLSWPLFACTVWLHEGCSTGLTPVFICCWSMYWFAIWRKRASWCLHDCSGEAVLFTTAYPSAQCLLYTWFHNCRILPATGGKTLKQSITQIVPGTL